MDVTTAYQACETITRARAANFFYGVRLLPKAKRRALSAVYAFARRVDDIGDGSLPRVDKLRELDAMRRSLSAIDLDSDNPVLVALADASAHLPIPLVVFEDLVDGVEMDVHGTSYETFDDLVLYCRRVAGSIGRLSVGVFESHDIEHAMPLADTLGVALQLTNILRDVREDLQNVRIYLPLEDLSRFGCDLNLESSPDPAFTAMVRFEAERARVWFDEGLKLISLLDARSAACAGAMAGIYKRILQRIEHDPAAAFRGRVSLSAWEKAWIVARSLAGA